MKNPVEFIIDAAKEALLLQLERTTNEDTVTVVADARSGNNIKWRVTLTLELVD